MKRIVSCLIAVTVAAAAPAFATPADEPVELSGLEIRASNNVILRLNVSGDLGPATVVLGDVAGLNCGRDQYKYTPHENRQCWVWVRRHSQVKLTVKGLKGRFGADWNVAWSGCQPAEGGAACMIKPEEDTEVSAVLSGTPQ